MMMMIIVLVMDHDHGRHDHDDHRDIDDDGEDDYVGYGVDDDHDFVQRGVVVVLHEQWNHGL
jgi:hypothetical protein